MHVLIYLNLWIRFFLPILFVLSAGSLVAFVFIQRVQQHPTIHNVLNLRYLFTFTIIILTFPSTYARAGVEIQPRLTYV